MEQSVRAPLGRDLNMPLFLGLLAHAVVVQAVVALARVTTTYRAIELDLSVVWIGVIAAGFSIMPIFVAVSVGRFIDRGNDSVAAWIGAGLMLVACGGLWLAPNSAVHLLVFSVILGVGQLFCMAAHQMIAVRCAGPKSRENVFGYFMIAIGAGQGLGPLLLGVVGGKAAVPPTGALFTFCAAGALLCLFVAFGLRPAPPEAKPAQAGKVVPLSALLRLHGFPAVLTASVMTVTAFELMAIYLPLLGTERHIDTGTIGTLLAVRSLVSVVSRLFYARLLETMGRLQLMVSSILIGAVAIGVLGLPVPLFAMYAAVVAIGLGLGIAATLTFSEVVVLAPIEARATALSLRITGNRLGQALLPFIASVVATATGAGGVLVITALVLAASGIAVRMILKPA